MNESETGQTRPRRPMKVNFSHTAHNGPWPNISLMEDNDSSEKLAVIGGQDTIF